MPRKPSVARGAVIQRDLVQRWARRQIRRVGTHGPSTRVLGYQEALKDLQQWLKEETIRAKKPGGIGR